MICNCTLHITNPSACESCLNRNMDYWAVKMPEQPPYRLIPFDNPVKKIVIEKYDKDDNLLERTVTTTN